MFTIHPQNQFIHNNEDAVFECGTNRNTSLTIGWTRNKEHISNSHSEIFKITNEGERSILKVMKATEDCIGVYQCIATNADKTIVLSKVAEMLSKP